jgi:hypothetical protein
VKRFLNGSAAQVSVAPSEAIQPVAALTIPITLRKLFLSGCHGSGPAGPEPWRTTRLAKP